ncbi:hypothetical protein GCM10011611_42020 [Aliidongia dinghuensis]|uniref:DUF1993 domain-containing protein n=1 Tax=Aliidongia dinghuensis TaxID=1867774 RepID=A0A8J3E501_9PROT|nr:DUF1993 domain-containing protein [Aliidongia dinghuensis]GGF31443.1 hypothetical protein GCM10011611_42020 [Aliidongia dinghuensis]
MAMQISLYDASVGSYLQTLNAVAGLLSRGLAHCRDKGIDLSEIVEARLIADMQPFRFQIQRIAFHSAGAIEAIRTGILGQPAVKPLGNYAALQALIDETRAALADLPPEAVNARAGAEVIFRAGEVERLFTAEGFLLSFSLPNFHFHATTAYGILRSRGVPLSKLDYMGALRLKEREAL